ncbi:MAG TPA: LEA type 2 family protein [Anaeromyxobacter sp.]|nr:LEA type 2 family protein [Anaeromyxobacter sp.]
MRKTLLALALPVLLSGCAGLQDLARAAFKEPRLTFKSAALDALDLEGATVAFTWEIENPNALGVNLARAGWQMEVEGTRIAAGDLPAGLSIPANGKAPLSFPVRLRFRDVPGIVSLLGSGRSDLGYRLSGSLGIKTPIGIVDLPMSHTDRVTLPAVPRFALDGLRVRSVSLSTVAVDVRVRVQNPNAFHLPNGDLDYALALAGTPVARAAGASVASVPGGGSATVEIPVKIDVLSAGRVASDLARGGEVQVELTGKAQLAGLSLPVELRGRVPARR